MASNQSLNRAKGRKNDEFYTQLVDIENEVGHYRSHFKDKVVYLNCDDPTISNFWVYFERNFELLGLRKLIATCYRSQNRDMFSDHKDELAIRLEYEGTKNPNSLADYDDVKTYPLEGDGDFRSNECIEILKQSDIVVTNPPFSLFREYIAQLMKYEKGFLILGSHEAIKYREVFPLLKAGSIWFGVNNGGKKWFRVHPDYEIKSKGRQKWECGEKYFSMGSINWYTNLDHRQRHEPLVLFRRYYGKQDHEYPPYDNYPEAIEVKPYTDIPEDYEGEMGVPITFLSRHSPEQFEIVGMDRDLVRDRTGKASQFVLNGKTKYARIVIKRKDHHGNPKA